MVNASTADEPPAEASERFTQAANRTFKAFDREHEQTWRRSFFFMQLADTQYGMFTGNKGFEQEVALVQQAVEHINRLRPRFVIVCGDLTNATHILLFQHHPLFGGATRQAPAGRSHFGYRLRHGEAHFCGGKGSGIGRDGRWPGR